MRPIPLWRHQLTLVVALALSLSMGIPPVAAAPNPVPNPLNVPFYSQLDPRWAFVKVGLHRDVRMMKMGSLLSCVAMVAASEALQVKFAVPGTDAGFFPTPDYIHEYLRENGGYRPGHPEQTVIIDYAGLTRAFLAGFSSPAGLLLHPFPWPLAQDTVDFRLDLGQATILILQLAPDRFHPVVVVGWDANSTSYLIHDPSRLRWENFPLPIRVLYGDDWAGKVSAALFHYKLILADPNSIEPAPLVDDDLVAPLVSTSTKSPVETVVVDPKGRRVGFDATTGAALPPRISC
jgi:hypothetical protein